MDERWTEVQYGRRRQRTRQPRWDQGYGGSNGWMDRATSFSSRGRFQVPIPNPAGGGISSPILTLT